MMATSNSSQHEILCHISNLKDTNADKSSRSFTKIPEKYQNMILVASSSGEVTEVEINEKSAEFFKFLSLLNTSILLNRFLEA